MDTEEEQDIVEWLREMQSEYEGSGTVIDYAGNYKRAADEIERLRKENERLTELSEWAGYNPLR